MRAGSPPIRGRPVRRRNRALLALEERQATRAVSCWRPSAKKRWRGHSSPTRRDRARYRWTAFEVDLALSSLLAVAVGSVCARDPTLARCGKLSFVQKRQLSFLAENLHRCLADQVFQRAGQMGLVEVAGIVDRIEDAFAVAQ